jgi:DNA repair protein RecO (recombination protein O)
MGKISAIAKGARRKKNPYEGAIDLIAICRIVFLHKSSQSLDILTEAKLERRFRSASTDLDRFYAGLYLIELLNLLTDEADPHELLFDAACLAIERIDGQESDFSLRGALIEFEIRMLDLLGHLPMLTQCVSCGRKRKTMNRVHFGLNEGGVICPDCRPGKQNIISLSSEGLELLLKLTDHTKTQSMKTKEYSSNQPAYPEIRRLVSKYILHLIGYPPRLQKYLGNL